MGSSTAEQGVLATLDSQTNAQKRAAMVGMGLHPFYSDFQPARGRTLSSTFRNVTLKIVGSSEKVVIPCQTCTRVIDVRQALSQSLMVDAESLTFFYKISCTTRKLMDSDELRSTVLVKGLSSFRQTPHKWKHPTAVIGAGYHGLKTMIMYAKSGNRDIVCFDRNDKVGGYCWVTAANKASKLQTEFGAFHVWWGHDSQQGECTYPTSWSTWPKKPEVLKHFQFAAENFGILPYIKLQSNVDTIDVVGNPKDDDSYYKLGVASLKGGNRESVNCSVLFSYPGSMTKNRIVEYPGEDQFDGTIGYGMGDCCEVDFAKDQRAAILGNGAFAVENARTLVEKCAAKVYIVTRRKNLASPRVPCWFVHQGPMPTPGRMVLKMFEPMYEFANFGDPWKFWAVNASADKQKVQIIQASRFGIGDVTFLMMYCGLLEYVVDTVKRVSKHTLHLDGGDKLENVTFLCKALGLLGDFEFDRLHKMNQVVGIYCDGDWRRPVYLDATGMNAANFTTFSTGIGTTSFVRMNKYFFDHPKEMHKIIGMGLMDQLPKNKAKPNEDKPAYVFDVNHTNSAMVMIQGFCPASGADGAVDPCYKYKLYHTAHPLDKFLDECIADWDQYQKTWRERGVPGAQEYVPYPYNRQMIEEYFKEYNEAMKLDISSDGRMPASFPQPEDCVNKGVQFGQVPDWIQDPAAVKQSEGHARTSGQEWWKEVLVN